MINKNCYYCKKPSALYLKSSESYSSDQFNFASTEIDAKDTEKKPNLFICKSCDIIFSEYCDEPFEDHYKDVLDNQYIEQIEYKKRDHALFVAFAPYSDPKYAISVVVEHGGTGSGSAAPIAKKVIKKVLDRHQLRKKYQLDLFQEA